MTNDRMLRDAERKLERAREIGRKMARMLVAMTFEDESESPERSDRAVTIDDGYGRPMIVYVDETVETARRILS